MSLTLDHRVMDECELRKFSGESVEERRREVLERARLLNAEDRELVEMCLRDGLSRRRIGRVMDIPPATITRRLQKLAARLHDPLVAALLDQKCRLAGEWRQVGIERLLQRLTIQEIADRHQMNRRQVEQILHFVKEWHRLRLAGAEEE